MWTRNFHLIIDVSFTLPPFVTASLRITQPEDPNIISLPLLLPLPLALPRCPALPLLTVLVDSSGPDTETEPRLRVSVRDRLSPSLWTVRGQYVSVALLREGYIWFVSQDFCSPPALKRTKKDPFTSILDAPRLLPRRIYEPFPFTYHKKSSQQQELPPATIILAVGLMCLNGLLTNIYWSDVCYNNICWCSDTLIPYTIHTAQYLLHSEGIQGENIKM